MVREKPVRGGDPTQGLGSARPRVLYWPISATLAWCTPVGWVVSFPLHFLYNLIIDPKEVGGIFAALVFVVVVIMLLLPAAMGLLLLVAAWEVWRGRRSGRYLLLVLASISTAMGLVLLSISFEAYSANRLRPLALANHHGEVGILLSILLLAYGVGLLYVMTRPDVRAYFNRGAPDRHSETKIRREPGDLV